MLIKNKTPSAVTAAKGAFKLHFAADNTKINKRLPPYGREAHWLLSKGVKPRNDIHIFAGFHAWKKAKSSEDIQVVMLLPFGADPSNYFWPVAGCPVLVFNNGGLSAKDIELLAYQLLHNGAEIVRTYHSDRMSAYYSKD